MPQHLYRALFTGLGFLVFVGLTQPRAFEYLALFPWFTAGLGLTVGVNAVVAYLLTPLAITLCRLPVSGEEVADEVVGIAVTAVIAGALFAIECYTVGYVWYHEVAKWHQIVAYHWTVFRVPVCAATIGADLMLGPWLASAWEHFFRHRR